MRAARLILQRLWYQDINGCDDRTVSDLVLLVKVVQIYVRRFTCKIN